MHIEIDVPRPYLTTAVALGIVWFLGTSSLSTARTTAQTPPQEKAPIVPLEEIQGFSSESVSHMKTIAQADPSGGSGNSPADTERERSQDLKSAWTLKRVLEKKEEIIRFNLKRLEEERRMLGKEISEASEEQFRDSARTLTGLLQSERALEQFLSAALRQIADAQDRAGSLARGSTKVTALQWPVDPGAGITARFHDPEYEEIFGFPHTGVDIRATQGTLVRAAAAGTVVSVKENGLGYNSITIQHEGGFATLYGHVSALLAEEGATVMAGDPIAESGGLPGTPGAGFYTTGSHLHFELYIGGEAVDPETYLPLP